ncbi:hypothetical protein [Nostoc sp.]|uniref:hypothetical protein n=1 Tax=Nostoc sp. TaxID=1180 RepID=UPI002FF5E335
MPLISGEFGVLSAEWGISLLYSEKRNCFAQCPMPNAQCPMPNAQCPIPNPQCPMPNNY